MESTHGNRWTMYLAISKLSVQCQHGTCLAASFRETFCQNLPCLLQYLWWCHEATQVVLFMPVTVGHVTS